MPATRLDVIERSTEKTRLWLSDLAEELDTEDAHHAYRVLRAFLHAIRSRLSVDEVAQLSAQLPIFIRGLFFEGWDPGRRPDHPRDLDSFLSDIATEALLSGETEASLAASAAYRVLTRHVSLGESSSLLHVLPDHLRRLLAA